MLTPKQIYDFYAAGFRNITVGKKLWLLIFIKLAILFGILKIFFFPDFLGQKADSDSGKAEVVRNTLTDSIRNYPDFY